MRCFGSALRIWITETRPSQPYPSAAKFLTQYFKFQPAIFGIPQLFLSPCKGCTRRLESGPVPKVKLRRGNPFFQRRDFFFEGRDFARQSLKRVLFLEAQPPFCFAFGLRRRCSRLWSAGPPCSLRSGWAKAAPVPLGDHIGIAARIFDPAAIAFRSDRGGGYAIEKIAVVADEDKRARIVRKHFLKHIERLKI